MQVLGWFFFSLRLSVQDHLGAAVVQVRFMLLCLVKQKKPGQVEWQPHSRDVDRSAVVIASPKLEWLEW